MGKAPTRHIEGWGTVVWRRDGVPHRMRWFAVMYPNGRKEWWENGKQHRLDGPAIIDPMYKAVEYWVDDQFYGDDEAAHFEAVIRYNLNKAKEAP